MAPNPCAKILTGIIWINVTMEKLTLNEILKVIS